MHKARFDPKSMLHNSPMALLMVTARSGAAMRLMQRFADQSIRRMAMFKAKRFYISFRPLQKFKDQARARQLADEANAKRLFDRINAFSFSLNFMKLNLRPPKQKEKSGPDGILAVFAEKEV